MVSGSAASLDATSGGALVFGVGGTTVSGNATLEAGGPVSQSGKLDVGGDATLIAGSQPVTLMDSTNRIIDLTWHPTGNYLAVTLEATKEVALYKVLREGGKLKNIEMVGKPFKVGNTPTSGRFSDDGKYYYVMDTKGAMGKATANGDLHVVEFSLDGSGEHKVSSTTPVGTNPGAFAISPDGSMVVAVNSGTSGLPWDQAGAGTSSSLSLYKLAGGALTKVADYPFPGILPQSVAFDKDGSNIAVAVYEYLDYGRRTGGVEFWTVTKGDTPALTKQLGKFSVERGCHTIRVIP